MYKILVLNLGGTSSKMSIYHDDRMIEERTINHTDDEMRHAPLSSQQKELRLHIVRNWIAEKGYNIGDFQGIAIRGATIKQACRSGTYLVSGKYKELLMELYIPEQPLVNGIRIITPLALELTGTRDIPVFITDPPSVDEFQPVAKLSGLAEYPRVCRMHVLNQKAVARRHAQALGKAYNKCNFVVAHIGGGVSIAAHRMGRIIDASDAGDGYGPFSTDRPGTVSTEAMLDMCYNRGMTLDQIYPHIRGGAGVFAHLGTKDMRIAEQMMLDGDKNAELVITAFAYQVAKEIGAYAVCLRGEVDAILMTGGIANSKVIVGIIGGYVETIAPLSVYPGEFENEALALGALRVLSGAETPILLDQ